MSENVTITWTSECQKRLDQTIRQAQAKAWGEGWRRAVDAHPSWWRDPEYSRNPYTEEGTDMTEVVQPRLTRITGETTDHEHIDVTGWVHSVVSRRDVSADYLEWVEGATRHVDRMTFLVDITTNGERLQIELLNYTAHLEDKP